MISVPTTISSRYRRLQGYLFFDFAIISALMLLSIFIRAYFLSYKVLFTDQDCIGYLIMAKEIDFSLPNFFETISIRVGPLYPLFIRIFSDISHVDFALSARMLSMIFGSLVLIPFFLLARSLYGKQTAIFGSILLLSFPYMVQISLNALTESTFIFFFILSVYLLFVTIRSNSLTLSFLSGIMLSVSYLIRPEAFLYVPLFLIAIFYFLKKLSYPIRKIFITFILFILGFSMLSLPFIFLIHNRIGVWTFSGKVTGVVMQHGVDRNDPFWYEKAFYSLSDDGKEIVLESRSSYSKASFFSIFTNLKGEIKRFAKNLYWAFNFSFSDIFNPLWFMLFGIGLLMRVKYHVTASDFLALGKDIFLLCIVASYICIFSLHNINLRHFAAIVPFLILLGGFGLSSGIQYLTGFSSDRKFAQTFLPIALLSIILVVQVPELTRPMRNISSSRSADSLLFRDTGEWVRDNLPKNPRIMSRKGYLSHYANGEFIIVPFASFDKILHYAKVKGADYLSINTRLIHTRPQLKFLLDPKEAPDSLELIKTFRYQNDRLHLYKFNF